MKKLFILFMVLFVSLSSFSQLTYDKWETINYVDEFGDETGESAIRLLCKGTFSNSATTNSDLIVKFILDKKSEYIAISLYEYGSSPEASMGYDSSFGNITVKLEDGTKKTFKTFAPKSGGLFFTKGSYNDFIKFLTTNSNFKVYIGKSDFENNGSSYLFEVKPKLEL